METVATTLDWLGTAAFRWSAIAFLLVNAIAGCAFMATKSRLLVNRWTARLVFANVALLGTGLGVPALTKAASLVVQAVAATTGHSLTTVAAPTASK